GGETIQTIYLGPGDDQNLVFEKLKMPQLTVTKIDAEDSKPIPGTVFTVEGIDSDFSADWTTGADGTVTDRVTPGSYKITEKSVPAPYYLPSKNADREQTVSLNAGDEVNVTFRNRKMPQLTIYKEDSVAGASVEGAKFHITYTSSGESAEAPATIDYGNILTDAKGEIRLHEQGKRLYPGEYTVTEVEPAPGFQMKEPSTQKIILHGSESKTLTFQNTPLNAIIVEKYDSVTHEALPGCTFQLRFLGGTSGTGGTTIGQKVTGKSGTAIWTGLKSGTYIVEEVDPADGYSIINASETIYLADSGEQSVVTVRFDNAPDGILLIRKVCSVNPSVTLANAEFKITYADGTLIGDANGIFRTDEHGEIRVPGLKPGKSVIVTETKAPDGYIIDTQSQTVQIKEGRTVSLTFKNQPKGKLIIQKRDSATGQPLPGAEFRVTTAAGCEVGLDGVIGTATLTQNGIFTTDGQGEITITNLAPGAYVLTEIKAPAGYVMDRASTNVVIGKNGDTQTVLVKNSKAGTLVIDKRDSLTGKPLQGVTFKVTTSTGEFVPAENGQISSNGLYFTDKDGKITIHGVVGTLVVTETASIPGYTIDEASRTQTVVVNPNDTQTLHFTNTPSTTLVIEKYIEGTTTPLKGVTFLVTDSSGAVVGKSNGEFITDENGRVVIHDLEPGTTVTAREVKTVDGFVLDGAPKSILIKAGEVQTLRFYNVRAGGLTVIKKDEKTGARIPGVQFEIRKMDGEIVGTFTTDENGVIYLPEAENGWYAVTELKAADGYRLDDTPHRIEVRDGQTATLEITNKAISGILLHKVNAVTGEGIPGVTFLLYDSGNNPIAQETSDDRGYVRFENLTAGRYYLRELENEGYIPDTQKKTVYVKSGETTEIEWKNTPITGQIQVTKVSADYNAMNGWPAGTPIPNTVFEVYNARTNRLVDTIRTDKNGLAVSKPLPLARYKIVESKAAEFYGLDKTPIEVEIEYAGQIVKAAMTNMSLSTNVSIKKTGYVEVMPGQLVRYNFADIANNSTTALESFYWRDTLPVKAVRLQTIYTGTWNTPGNYKIVYRTNLSGGTWRTLADNLSTSKNYVLDASPAALGLAANEYVTEFMAAFGIVPANFRQVEAPRVDCKALAKLTGGTQFVNQADAGGVYNGQWIMATSRWVTRVYAPSKPLPRTGY
ncbi:SpaA isopeptide-forming pilin-related protein, partial [Dysosmobacter sp.]|uniref:SpaA isopeptide-forming pilin-related protein n=1 Tax=Dysosmobacter sp. TaxID=2591382 RepID=UPI003AB6CC01